MSLVLWSLSQAARAFTGTYAQLLAARTALGVTEAAAYPAAVSITAAWFESPKRGLPTSVFNMGANPGVALAPPFLTWLSVMFGWLTMFVVLGLLGIAASVMWFLFYRVPGGKKFNRNGAPP